MKRQFLLFIFITCAVVTNVQSANQSINGTYNILNYGADTLNVCTQAINNAIESAYRNGGGKVIIPAGRFRSGTIFLKDNIELHLSGGAILEASDDYSDFPLIPPTTYRSLKDAGGWSALIYAEKANHISITGKGTIDGKGKGRKGRVQGVAGDCNGRPRNILLISCKNVSVSGVTMLNSAIWNQHYLDCEDVTVTDIRVFNHANGNNDGIDIDGCRRFILSDSVIDSDDDGIVLKSTGIAPCEDIVITNCIVSSFANAIKCGTESTGGFRNILISDCIVKPSRSEGERVIKSTPTGITAISLEVVDGGVMEGVTVNNILIEGTECPLYIRLANRGRKHISSAPIPPIGVMRNIQISNITAYGTGNFCSSITGIPERKIENIYLNNIRFVNKGGLAKGNFLTKELVEGVRHDMAKSMYPDKYWASFKDIIEDEKGYPQPTVWRNLPSYGLFIRNVETLELSNGTFTSEKPEPRNPIIAVNVDKLYLHQINAGQNSSSEVLLHKVPDIDADPSLKVRIEQ
mgnify:FL=1